MGGTLLDWAFITPQTLLYFSQILGGLMKELTDSELIELIDKAIDDYVGNSDELVNAIGVLMVGRKIGWRPTFLMHSTKSIKKYEKYLGIEFREILPDIGPKAKKSIAWRIGQKISNYWKLVKGEIADVRTPDWTHLKK
jgi:hypothetical protein